MNYQQNWQNNHINFCNFWAQVRKHYWEVWHFEAGLFSHLIKILLILRHYMNDGKHFFKLNTMCW